MTNLTKWATTVTIKRFIKKIITEFALLTLSCFKSFLFMSRYYCQSHCWNNAKTPSMLFLGLAVLIFCQWMQKPCFFAFCKFCKLAYLMGGCVSLRSDITHFVLMIHALLTQILKYCFCAIFSCLLSVCAIFFPFSDFGPFFKRNKHCERQSGPRLGSAYESNLVK